MSRSCLLLLPLLFALPVPAQAPAGQIPAPPPPKTQEELQKLRAARLSRASLQKVHWLTDYDQALATAKKEKKPILAYFTQSSGPCVPCDQLEDSALGSTTFVGLAARVVCYVNVHSDCNDEKQTNLQRSLGYGGYPAMIWIDGDGALLVAQTARDPEGIVAMAEKAIALDNGRRAVAEKAEGARKKLLLAQLDLAQLEPEAIRAGSKDLVLDEREKAFVDTHLVDAEIRYLQKDLPKVGREEVAKRVVAIYQQNRRPSSDGATMFWGYCLIHAAAAKDARLGDEAFAVLQQMFGKESKGQRALQQYQDMLDKAHGR